jgi:cardiolipin synthase
MTVLTVANQLTLVRMLLIPGFVLLVVYGEIGWALAILLVAGITDALDGLIARRAGQKTTLGAWLDPMADKLLLTSAFVVLTVPGTAITYRIPLWLTVCILSRDIVIVVTVAIVNLAMGRRTFRPSILGKAATGIYILTCLLCMALNYLRVDSPLLTLAVKLSFAITVVSSLHYIVHAARIINGPEERG